MVHATNQDVGLIILKILNPNSGKQQVTNMNGDINCNTSYVTHQKKCKIYPQYYIRKITGI